MKYSIIIPTLNEEKLLPNLLSQLYKIDRNEYDIEIVISDGGSTDSTLEIALNYADIIKVHDSEYKQNIAMGRNVGAQYATGDILIFLNGDVLISDEKKFFYFVKNNFVGTEYLAMTCFVKIFPEEELLVDKLYHGFYNGYFKLLNVIGIGMGRGECHVIKKEIFQKVNGYSNLLAAGEDFDLFTRIRKFGKILYTDNITVYESPRRYRKVGYFGVTWSWFKNGLSVLFKNRSISKEWEQVR